MKRKIFIISMLCLLFCSGIFSVTTNALQSASAASSMAIQTLRNTRYTDKIIFDCTGDPSNFPESHTSTTYNTGIMFYSASNTGQSNTVSEIKLDSRIFYIDFSSAKDIYSITTTNHFYEFKILNSQDQVVWQASQVITSAEYKEGENTVIRYTINQNVNGSESKYFDRGDVDARLIGRQTVNLADGNYTINSTYTIKSVVQNPLFGECTYITTQATMGNMLVDSTPPLLSVNRHISGENVTSGSYLNQLVEVSASDVGSATIYYKSPNMDSYSQSLEASYTSSAVAGWHYIYAEDECFNRSETFSFYYDETAPTGKITSSGVNVADGSYIAESFSYSATDSGSGVEKCFYKKPNTSDFQQCFSGIIITKDSGDGWYSFYSVDKSGNVSNTISVYLETAKPVVEIYRNNTLSYEQTVTSTNIYETNLYFNIGDTLKIVCDTPSENITSNFPLNTDIVISEANFPLNNYEIELEKTTGIIGKFKFQIVRELPKLFIGGTAIGNGETLYFNTDKLISWSYDPIISSTGVSGIIISSAGNINMQQNILHSSGQTEFNLTTESNSETIYSISLSDAADNILNYTVVIDKERPQGKLVSNGNELTSGGYTNRAFYLEFTEIGVTAQYSVNGGEYTHYTSGQTLSADATYIIVLTDRAGNKTNYTVIVDTIAPVGQLYADSKAVESDSITNSNISFSWDENVSATVNGVAYTKNTVLSEDNEYTFVLRDLAGNASTYVITIDTVPPSYNTSELANDKTYTISRWYLTQFEGIDYSFATYETALEFASQKEFNKNATVLWLANIEDFTQTHLVASNGNPNNSDDNVRTGTYWLYKSKTNPSALLYYFDENLLNEVIAFYAKDFISEIKYYVLGGNNNYGICNDNMYDNLLMADNETTAFAINNYVFIEHDSVELFAELVGGDGTQISVEYGVPFKNQFAIGGLYKITEIDLAKNEAVYYVYLDLSAPELTVTANIYGEQSTTELNINQSTLSGIAAYYYERFEIKEILDNDKWAVLSIRNSGMTKYYTNGDELPTLATGGEYTITLYDRLNNSYSFKVYIVGNPAGITFTNNSDDTLVSLKITLEQTFDTIVQLEIYKDGVLLEGISSSTLNYEFVKGGTYTVILKDNFGRVIEKTYEFNKALPTGTLTGVSDGGKTKDDVSFSYDKANYYAVILKDGVEVATDHMGEIVIVASEKNSGGYTIRLVNRMDADNFTDYDFAINTLPPDINLNGVKANGTTNSDVKISWSNTDISTALYKLNGTEFSLTNGQVLTEEGEYSITVINDLGTETTLTFTIDKTVDFSIMVDGETKDSLVITNKKVSLIGNENLIVWATKNGSTYAYALGDEIFDEGLYEIGLTDDYGNIITLTFTIDKTVSYTANVGNGVIGNTDIYITSNENLSIVMSKDGLPLEYNFGDKLNDEGLYIATMTDLCGNEKTIEFSIINSVKQRIDFTLGSNVNVISVFRGDEYIEIVNNHLFFTLDGEYTVTTESESEIFIFTLIVDSTAPTLELKGVKNGGTTSSSVRILNPSKQDSTVEVYYNGKLIDHPLEAELFEYGDYRVVIRDSVGNSSEYTFSIRYVMNGGAIALIVLGILAVVGTIGGIMFGKKAIYRKKQLHSRDEENEALEA